MSGASYSERPGNIGGIQVSLTVCVTVYTEEFIKNHLPVCEGVKVRKDGNTVTIIGGRKAVKMVFDEIMKATKKLVSYSI